MEHDFLGRYGGASEHLSIGTSENLKRQPYFSGRNIRNGNACSTSSKPSLIPDSGLRVAQERVIVGTAICVYLTPGIDTFAISRLARERPILKRQLPQIDRSPTSLRLRSAEYALCPELSMLRFCTFHRTISSLVFMWTLNVSNQHYGQL